MPEIVKNRSYHLCGHCRDAKREKGAHDWQDRLKADGWHAWGPLAEQRDTVSSVHFLLVTRRAVVHLAREPLWPR